MSRTDQLATPWILEWVLLGLNLSSIPYAFIFFISMSLGILTWEMGMVVVKQYILIGLSCVLHK